MQLPVPVDNICWIQLLLPKDLKYDEVTLDGTKIFGPPDGNKNIPKEMYRKTWVDPKT